MTRSNADTAPHELTVDLTVDKAFISGFWSGVLTVLENPGMSKEAVLASVGEAFRTTEGPG